MPFDAAKLAADTEAYCQKLRPFEETAYAERESNHEKVIGFAREFNLLGMNIAEAYGGRGADSVNYFKALTRIGREGTPVRTFFSWSDTVGCRAE